MQALKRTTVFLLAALIFLSGLPAASASNGSVLASAEESLYPDLPENENMDLLENENSPPLSFPDTENSEDPVSGSKAGIQPSDTSVIHDSLVNGGFEQSADSPAGWTPFGDAASGSLSIETNTEGYVFRGAHALRIDATGTEDFGAVSEPVRVTTGCSYLFNAHTRTEKGALRATVAFYDADGNRVGEESSYFAAGTGWKHITTNTSGISPAVAPQGAAYATVSLLVTPGDGGGEAYFDNVRLIELSDSLTLQNAGFEGGIDPATGDPEGYNAWEWGYGYYGTHELVASPVHSGQKSLKLITVQRQYSNQTIRTSLVSVAPGTEYEFSVYVYRESGAQPYLTIEYYSAGGAFLSGTPAQVNSTQSNQWEKLFARAVIPADVAYVSLTSRQVGAAGAGEYYVDDFDVSAAQPPVAGIDDELKNASFEQGAVGGLPTDWTKIGDAGAAVNVDNGDGTKSLSLTHAGGRNGVKSNRFKVEGGRFYALSVLNKNTTAVKPKLYMRFYAADNTPLAAKFWHGYEYIELAPDEDLQGLFRPASAFILAPENAASAELAIEQDAQNGGELLVDMVDLADATPAPGPAGGDFEALGTQPWGYPAGYYAHSWTSSAAAGLQSGIVYSGSSAVKMDMSFVTQASKRGGLITSLVPVKPGEAYEFNARVYNEGDKKLALYCYWIGADGVQNLSKYPSSGKTGEWELVTTGAVNAPSNAVAAAIMLYQAGGVSYVDDVSIKPVQPVTYSDKVLNPGFEEGLNEDGTVINWEKYGPNNSATISSDIVHSGNYAARLSASESGGNGLHSCKVAVSPNVMYRGQGMIYNDTGTSDLYLEFYNEAGNRIDVKTAALSRTREWIQVNVDAAAPQSAVYAQLLIYQSSNNHGVIYADDLSLAAYTPPDEEVREFSPIVSGHPRVAFTAVDIPALRAKAQDTEKSALGVSGKDIADQILGQADRYLDETEITYNFDDVYDQQRITIILKAPPTGVDVSTLSPPQPSGKGNYPFWTSISRGLEDRMEILSISYVLTGNSLYAEKAVAYAMAMTTWGSWHDPRDTSVTTNLDTAHILFGVLSVYDMLYDRLTPEQRGTIRAAMIEKALNPLYVDAKTKVDHNIQALRNTALTSGALGLMDDVDPAITNKYLTRSTEFFNWYLAERRDSGNQEGYGYTSYAMENMIDAFEQLARVTGDRSYVNNDWLNNDLTRWVAAFTAPGAYTLPRVSNYDGTKGFYQTFSVLANNGNGLAGWYLVNARPLGSVLLTKQFLYLNKEMPVTPPEQYLGKTAFIDNVGWGALRTGWGATDTVMGLISNGSALGHNHYDQNSFVIAANGDWIASDPGYSNFDYNDEWDFKSKVGHNTILVDWVKDTAAGAQIYKGGGSISPKLASDGFGYMVGRAAAPYGDLLSLFDRHAVMVNHVERPYFLLYDNLASAQPRTFTWSLFSDGWNALKVDGNAVDNVESSQTGSLIELEKGVNKLYTRFISEEQLKIDTGKYKSSFGPYIHVSNQEKAASQQFLAVMNTYVPGIAIQAPSFQASQQVSPGTTGALSENSALFRGETGAGAAVTWTFEVPESGEFDITLIMPGSYWYGIYQAAIDGITLGEPYDGYVPYPGITRGNRHSLGRMYLPAGAHTLTMTCLGTNDDPDRAPENIRYLTAVTSILLAPAGSDSSLDAPVEVTEQYAADGTLGARIRYAADKQDIVLFSKGGTVSGGALSANAAHASLLGLSSSGSFEGYAMTDGTQLTYQGSTLLTASNPVSALIGLSSNGRTSARVNADTAAAVTLHIGAGKKVSLVSGSGQYNYDSADGTLSFQAAAGESEKVFSVTTPAPGPDPDTDTDSDSGKGSGAATPVITLPDAGPGGRITLSADKKTVYITPDAGYVISDVLIDGRSVGPVSSYKFTDSKNHRVQVVFTKAGSVADAFTDIARHWANAAIRKAVDNGWFEGVSADRFAPDLPMSRAMLVTVLYRLDGSPSISGGSAFADVADGAWYADAVSWAASNGITDGVGGGRFAPDENLTREQIAKLLRGYAVYRGYDVSASAELAFDDARGVSDWALEAMAWAVGAGLIQGRGAGRLEPGAAATRAEVATILVRFTELFG